MTGRKRAITIIVLPQILALFGLLIWLWIRRYSQEGAVRTPRMEIELPPASPATDERAEQPVQVQTPVVPKPAPARRQAAHPDDLQRIEGIGPKIASTLQAAGIRTYKQLARARVERLKGIITEVGIIADPTTWPEQAALAAAEDWVALAELKSQLKGGRRTD
jgi:predicted flap endonuclease-1-like 5' DNA nuclease